MSLLLGSYIYGTCGKTINFSGNIERYQNRLTLNASASAARITEAPCDHLDAIHQNTHQG